MYPIVHIVRRFGRVGGMESYVWHLVHALTAFDYRLIIICEVCFEPSLDPRIETIELSEIGQRPRWKAMLSFRENVERVLFDKFNDTRVIVHSHERSISHHVTTFHGPPMRARKSLFSFDWLSQRVRQWKRMERNELLGASVQVIVAVSRRTLNELEDVYPDIRQMPRFIAWPGVVRNTLAEERLGFRFGRRHAEDCCNVVFVGKEWKRKGLVRAYEIISCLTHEYSSMKLYIYGPAASDLPPKIRNSRLVQIMDWSSQIPWTEYDILIHPAKDEPFGMVVAEARASGLPVLTSDQVGAIEIGFSNLISLPLDASNQEWATGFKTLISSKNKSAQVKWTWDELAEFYHYRVYPKIEL